MCTVPEMLRPTSHGMRAGGAQPQEPCGHSPWWDTVVGRRWGRSNESGRWLVCWFDDRIVLFVGQVKGNSNSVYSSVPLFCCVGSSPCSE